MASRVGLGCATEAPTGCPEIGRFSSRSQRHHQASLGPKGNESLRPFFHVTSGSQGKDEEAIRQTAIKSHARFKALRAGNGSRSGGRAKNTLLLQRAARWVDGLFHGYPCAKRRRKVRKIIAFQGSVHDVGHLKLAYTVVNNGRPRDEHLRDCDVGE